MACRAHALPSPVPGALGRLSGLVSVKARSSDRLAAGRGFFTCLSLNHGPDTGRLPGRFGSEPDDVGTHDRTLSGASASQSGSCRVAREWLKS